MSFEFLNNGIGMNIPGTSAPVPTAQVINNNIPYGYINGNQNQVIQNNPTKVIDPRQFETPVITVGSGFGFTVKKDENSDTPKGMSIPVDNTPSPISKRSKKESTTIIRADDNTKMVEKVNGQVENIPTAYTYLGTSEMLTDTLNQIDSINSELMQEFESVRQSRTMKNKYTVLTNLSENISSLISSRINTIKEMNNIVSKSNDLDYKKAKDSKAAAANVDDDRYIADLYKSFLSNQNSIPLPQYTPVDSTVFGSGIVRADIKSGDVQSNGPVDVGYLNYISNMSPETNAMLMESNPNIKECVVFDASNGNRFFQVIDTSTGQAIPNMPLTDQMFAEDLIIDRANKIAKNNNLKLTYPLIVINENSIQSQY